MIEPLESRRLLSVTLSAGRLDLTDNKLVVSGNSSASTTTYNTITGLVQAPQTVTPTSVPVAFTYFGDEGYDGKIDSDDYFLIDRNYTGLPNDPTGGVSAVGPSHQSDFSGTAKNDRIYIGKSIASFNGTPGPYTADDGTVFITINGNSDVTDARNLRINANAGDDYISIDLGEADADMHITIYGAAGNDTIIGGAEADRIFAGDGNDVVNAGDGKDTIYGEAGDDSLRGGGANDLLDGGDGADTLRGDAGNDNLSGGANSDRLRGSAGNDTLSGGGGSDMLAGEAGDDSLLGGAGSDKLDGGTGADFWDGGSGYDYIHAEHGDVSTSSGSDAIQFDQLDDHGNEGAVVQIAGGASSNTSATVDMGGLTKTGSGTLTSVGQATHVTTRTP